jgi:hypothetical protein
MSAGSFRLSWMRVLRCMQNFMVGLPSFFLCQTEDSRDCHYQ